MRRCTKKTYRADVPRTSTCKPEGGARESQSTLDTDAQNLRLMKRPNADGDQTMR